MTNQELIEILKTMPPDAEVWIIQDMLINRLTSPSLDAAGRIVFQ